MLLAFVFKSPVEVKLFERYSCRVKYKKLDYILEGRYFRGPGVWVREQLNVENNTGYCD